MPLGFLAIVYVLSCWIFICLPFYFRKECRQGWKTFFAFSFPTNEESIETGQFFLRLADFTVKWGLIGTAAGLVLMLVDLDPDNIGSPVAICLLNFLYASALAIFVFLPIALRLTPPETPPSDSPNRNYWWLSVQLLLAGFVVFFVVRFVVAIILLAISNIQSGDMPGELPSAIMATRKGPTPQGVPEYRNASRGSA
jgi:predicted cobalt transporter CbtA